MTRFFLGRAQKKGLRPHLRDAGLRATARCGGHMVHVSMTTRTPSWVSATAGPSGVVALHDPQMVDEPASVSSGRNQIRSRPSLARRLGACAFELLPRNPLFARETLHPRTILAARRWLPMTPLPVGNSEIPERLPARGRAARPRPRDRLLQRVLALAPPRGGETSNSLLLQALLRQRSPPLSACLL